MPVDSPALHAPQGSGSVWHPMGHLEDQTWGIGIRRFQGTCVLWF